MSEAAEPERRILSHTPPGVGGAVRHLHTGEVIGHAPDPVAYFIGLVRRCAERGPTYVVIGDEPRGDPKGGGLAGESDGLAETLLELGVPVRYDSAVGPTAQILEGSADEWTGELRETVLEGLRVRGMLPPAV